MQKHEDCSGNFLNIGEAFKGQPQLSLIVTLSGAKAGDVDTIANLQNQFLANLPAQVSVGAIYKVTPQIALETDLTGFNTIVTQNPAADIAPDETRFPIENN